MALPAELHDHRDIRHQHCSGDGRRLSGVFHPSAESMKMTRNSLGIVLVAIGIIAAERNACAQADLHVTVRRDAASGKSHVSWLVKSLVPSPGNAGFAGYQIWTSTNLTDWIPLGNPLSGLDFENKTIDRELPDLTGAPVFARIE